MPKTNPTDTRDRILAAAEPLVLRQGFAGTSLDDVVKTTGLSKGAFFHHFRDKADLARALAENYRENHAALFERFAAEANAESDDPLLATLGFLKRFESFVEARTKPLAGCIYAAYTYQSQQFDDSVRASVADGLKRWTALFEKRFSAILARHPARTATSPAELAEMVVAIIEGGLILSRSYGDAHLIARQLRHFRTYLGLLFANSGAPASA